jgi:hypothetical protein
VYFSGGHGARKGAPLAYVVTVMGLRRALCPVIAVIGLAGCGTSHRASAAPTPGRLRQLIERHQKFPTGVPTLERTGAPRLENLVPQKTIIIR